MKLSKSLENYPLISDWLKFPEPGRVSVRSGRVEIGQGISLALRRIVAGALNLPMAQIDLVAGDTRSGPDENYTAGSMSVELSGLALRAAGQAARAVAGQGDFWAIAASGGFDVPIRDNLPDTPQAEPDLLLDLSVAASESIRDRILGGGYIHDLRLPDIVHARVLTQPHPQARLLDLPLAEIEAMPGVLAVHRDGSFAAILAASEAEVMSAVARADSLADWDQPDGGVQTADDLLAGTAQTEVMTDTGVDAVTGNRRITGEFARPFLTHASIGTCCAIAQWHDDRLNVWSHAQGPFQLKAGLAHALKLAQDQIDVIHMPGAGCYGHNGADDVAFEAALLARARPGAPIRLAWRRADELTRGPLAPAMRSRATITLGDDGGIAAFDLDIVSAPHQRRPGPGKPNFAAGPLLDKPVLPAPASEPPPANGGGSDRNGVPMYRSGALRVARRVAYDIPLRTSAMRALGAYANVAAIELAMDAAAEETRQDPVSFRQAALDDPRARDVIRRVVDLSGFATETDGDSAMGLGFARYKNKAGYCAVVLEVMAGESLSVPRLWAVADVGEAIDPDGVVAQIEGGAIQALSWSLKEEVPIIGGAPAVSDWESYPILRFSEIPEIKVALIGDPASPPLGAGEIAQGPVAAALATAVRRLFGLSSISVPLTPDALARQII
ncbi:molybdopterin cofactor-binding domain-containing protein [Pseudooceanicola onchidii]|uniref:molybdopterin cofactor-binding domain-containing protein n=1 Tax=Pseudooceanicola onchidii TaxID=2562279 RepID=UPI00145A6A72|nr:molybdopterin cofactor-binding domain-containing protein [Pseudooceanicola onchidii]